MTSPNSATTEAAAILDFVNQERARYKEVDRQRDEVIAALLMEFKKLQTAYEKTKRDYEQEHNSLAMWQREARQLDLRLNNIKLANESNPFVFVTIDGDGAIFREDYLARGADGGAAAAFELSAQVRKHLKNTYPDSTVDDWNIMVQVVISLEGHAKTLHAAGIVQNGFKDFNAFAHAFGQAQYVGSGKERADHKIRETLRVMARLSQCRHVMFGPCHDNGYLPVLEPYKLDPIVGPKLTLIETTPATSGFVQLGLNRVKFPTVFRPEPLAFNNAYQSPTNMPLIRNGSLPVFNGGFQSQSSGFSFGSSHTSGLSSDSNGGMHVQPFPPPKTSSPPGLSTPPQPAAVKPVPPTPPASAPSASGSSSSYAAIGKQPVSLAARTIDITPKKPAPVLKYYYVNPSSERLDEELPRAQAVAEKKYNDKRADNGRNFCNKYHLLGYCDDGDEYCKYEHGERLTPSELLVQKHRARGTYCDNGIGCDDFDCYYAHHCRYGRDCGMGHKCKFNDTHHMDLKRAVKIYEDGTKERMP